jgi:hypothetical protein
MRNRLIGAGCLLGLLLALSVGLSACGSSNHSDADARAEQARADLIKRKADVAFNAARLRKLKREKARLEDKQRARRASADQTSTEPSDTGSGASSATTASFAKLADGISGEVGVAYGPPGLGQPVTSLGSWTTGPAWSSSKVPVSIAVVRADGGSPSGEHADLMRRAITASDNDAAESLWSSLGSPSEAGAKTQAVLRDAGDEETQVQTERVRAGFTAFGQTQQSLTHAEQLAAALPCLKGAKPVVDLMGQVTPDQSWGLGQAGSNQRFKGGWGPDESGKYLVRQLGLIDVDSGGTVAVAIATKPNDGSLETGSAQLTQLAQWVSAHAKGGAPSC